MSTATHRPDFNALVVKQIESQLEQLLVQADAAVQSVESQDSPTWHSFIRPQEQAHEAVQRFWSPVRHLNSVMNNDELRDVYNRCVPKLSAYWTKLGQNYSLYQTTQKLQASNEFNNLSTAQQKSINNSLRDFHLSGVSLDASSKARFAEIQQELSTLSTEFSDHVLDATNAWHKHITEVDKLEGMPESAIAAAAERAKAKSLEGYLITLDYPSYYAVMTFAKDRRLREEVYTAFCTRASDQGPHAGRFDNSAIIDRLLALRSEKAALLDYASYADYSVVPKMVETPTEVVDFLNDLARRALPQAQQEFDTLQTFAADALDIADFAAWDVMYASDKLKQKLHALSDEDLKPYFPAAKAISGMFEIVGRLFGITISKVEHIDVYHPDVEYYTISDANGELRGDFYLDLYARENKRGGAWMDVCTGRMELEQGVQTPIAYLTCNLTPPVGDDPALLTHMEVTTLFHEFGHGLHHMLTRVDVAGVSGIDGVEWDAVELPSQFLENWCWERESLDLISGHYQTGDAIPDELLEKLRQARNFQSAMQLMRQLEFSLFDMRIHLESTAEQVADVQAMLNQVRSAVSVVPTPAFNRFQHGFSHIFAGGYAAGYFSYKWAEVLSADAFARFEEEGIFNADAGRAFLEEILEQGGSRPAMQSFKAFRGREPQVDALLRHSGLSVQAA